MDKHIEILIPEARSGEPRQQGISYAPAGRGTIYIYLRKDDVYITVSASENFGELDVLGIGITNVSDEDTPWKNWEMPIEFAAADISARKREQLESTKTDSPK